MIKGAIFDMDGVMLDSLSIWWDLGVLYLKKHGITPTQELSETLFSMSQEQGVAYLKEHFHLPQSETEIRQELLDTVQNFYFNEVSLKPGAAELLAALKAQGIRIEGATSSNRAHVEHALQRNGILPYFERIWTNAEIGESKHTPKIYLSAAEDMGFDPSEILVFEDSLYALKTAKQAGFHTIGVFDPNGETDQQGLENESEVYLRSLTEFKVQGEVH